MTNIDWLIPTAILITDKAVTVSPSKKDDIILTSIKTIIDVVKKK
jgi:hypothetical protein